MLDRTKTDAKLGEKIHSLLIEEGVETPMQELSSATYDDKYNSIRDDFRNIMKTLGLDLSDDSLERTPDRIAKMYLNEVFWGLDYSNFPKVTTIKNKMQYSSMLIERNISVKSQCEHHFLPFIGNAFVAYIPDRYIIGLSKINRIVEFFSRRPQVQERLTEQVFYTLMEVLHTDDVAVCIKSEHTCVKLRGVEDTNSDTLTTRLGGAFMDDSALRNEFYQSIKL